MLQSSANKLRKLEASGEAGMPLVEAAGVPQGSALCRTASCVEDPQASALSCLKGGDLRLLSDILAELGSKLDINQEYPAESFKTLLQITVEDGNVAAVRLLLRAEADPAKVNPVLKTTPVHTAAGQGNYEILSTLIEYSGHGCLSACDRAGRTPLHLAVISCKRKPDTGLQCVRLCLEKGSEVNTADNKGGQTPLYLAASSKLFDAVKLLLDHGADSSIPCQGMSTRQLIKDSFTAAEVSKLDLTGSSATGTSNLSKLVDLVDRAELNGPDDNAFRMALAKASLKDINSSNGKKSLVQMCADRGLDTYLYLLLGKGASPNTTTPSESSTALLLAAHNGFSEVLKVLLDSDQLLMNGAGDGVKLKVNTNKVDVYSVDSNGMTVLHNVLRKPLHGLENSDDGGTDYPTCLDHLLTSRVDWSRIINTQDLNLNTPLHYAVQFWDQETVTKLLLLGANIGLKNRLEEAPISSILPQTMEDFLNNHCISSKGNPTNDDFRITFKYDFLAPPRESLPLALRPEDGGAKHFVQDKENQEGDEGALHLETEVLWYMAGSSEHRHLLKHPVITSFLALKWSRISHHYNSNLLFYTLLVSCLTAYIFCTYGGASLGVHQPSCTANTTLQADGEGMTGTQLGLWWTVFVLFLLVTIRELFQFAIAGWRYFQSIENVIEIGLILSVSLLLGYGEPGCYIQTKKELASAAIMFSWVELVTMVGRHPMLASYNTYLTMFYRVLKTFLQFLAWYSLFILAFSLSFYILLHKDTTQGEESEYVFFDHVGLCIVKTFSMFVGELEFSDLPLSGAYSYIFFLFFVFLIVVVLMNLLNGLAVSDTGLIREEAEIHSHVCRVEVISAAEATILGDPAHILKGPGKLIPTCGLRRKLGAVFRIRKVFQRLLGSTGIMLFYSVLPGKRLVVYPNRRSLVCSPCVSSKDVGREILDSAKNLILRLAKEAKEKEGIEQVIKELRRRQESLEDKMSRVLIKLDNISNSLRI